jgi:membrane protease subunit (stomatin/prohibitin family)
MRTDELATWIAAGVAIIAVGVAAWQLWLAHRRAGQVEQLARRIREMARSTEGHAEQAAGAAQGAHSHARWAWEQVKLASSQLAEAQQEHQASTEREQWEWAYAMTTTAKELVDCSQELIRIALDGQIAPHYRTAAQRHYGQVCQWWQETAIKALARTSPTLELQQQVITFNGVHQRLHGSVGVLLRAAETEPLTENDALAKQALQAGQELAGAHRHLQRAVSTSLTTAPNPPEGAARHSAGSVAGPSAPSAPTGPLANANTPRRVLDHPRRAPGRADRA